MSRWGIEQVATWARAQWADVDKVVQAVAVAMAASGGNDHYDSNPGYHPDTERRGLYALTAAEAAPTAFSDLFDPVAATAAAHARWEAAGGSWAWHPAWASGAALAAIPQIRAVVVDKVGAPAAGPVHTFAEHVDYLGRLSSALQSGTRPGPG